MILRSTSGISHILDDCTDLPNHKAVLNSMFGKGGVLRAHSKGILILFNGSKPASVIEFSLERINALEMIQSGIVKKRSLQYTTFPGEGSSWSFITL